MSRSGTSGPAAGLDRDQGSGIRGQVRYAARGSARQRIDGRLVMTLRISEEVVFAASVSAASV
jgi:hypothetical protein